MSLSKIVALVTGAGQGLGRATALRLGSLGAKVMVIDLSEEKARAVAAEIGDGKGMFAAIDVTDEEGVKSSIKVVIPVHIPLPPYHYIRPLHIFYSSSSTRRRQQTHGVH